MLNVIYEVLSLVYCHKIVVVADKPDAPHDLRYVTCLARSATLTWAIPNDHSAPIIEYLVYMHTNFDADNVYKEVMKVPAETTTVTVPLTPFRTYVFRVTAVNKLGQSKRSAATVTTCKIPPERPFRHPSGVCVESGDPTALIIVWEVGTIVILVTVL